MTSQQAEHTVLVLYHSNTGGTAALAQQLAEGAEEAAATRALVRTVPKVFPAGEAPAKPEAPGQTDTPYATLDDLKRCDALALGSPTHFGNMGAPMKRFLDATTGIWREGNLIGKPACVFTASSSLHGGQETTLWSMMLPLMHQGMIMVGLPYSLPSLARTESGGTPYGASHWSRLGAAKGVSDEEAALARALGRRLAEVSLRLRAGERL